METVAPLPAVVVVECVVGRGRGCGSHSRRRGEQSCHEATGGSAEEKGWSEGSSVQVQPFSMNVGPTFPLEEEPAAIFSALFTPQLLDHIVVETNRFVTLCLTSTHEGEGPPPTWETDAEEIGTCLSGLCHTNGNQQITRPI